MSAVVDASAVLAFLLDEPGADVAGAALEAGGSLLSAVNLSEVLSKLSDRGLLPDSLALLIEALPIEVVPFDAADAHEAALLRDVTRTHGLSLGDRACLALARSRGLPAVTADREWKRLPRSLGIVVETIR